MTEYLLSLVYCPIVSKNNWATLSMGIGRLESRERGAKLGDECVTSSFCEWRIVRSLNRTQGCRNNNKVIYSK